MMICRAEYFILNKFFYTCIETSTSAAVDGLRIWQENIAMVCVLF